MTRLASERADVRVPVGSSVRLLESLVQGTLMRFLGFVALALVWFGSSMPAASYPVRPIRLIVPFAPGGPNDISARIVAEELSRTIGQSVMVENRPGAGGNVGAEAAARAAADGHTLFWAQAATHGINPSLYRRLAYDAVKDFTPVGLILSEPLVLVTRADAPWHDVNALIAAAKAKPGAINIAHGGHGTTPHMAGTLFGLAAGAQFVHVPYKGNGPALADVTAGRVELLFDGINAAIGHIRAGTLRALAVTSRGRAPTLPDVPTLGETLPGYEVVSWGGIVAPAQTPREIIARLSQELVAINDRPAVRQRFAELGADLRIGAPGEMDAFMRAQIAQWRAVIERAGIAMD